MEVESVRILQVTTRKVYDGIYELGSSASIVLSRNARQLNRSAVQKNQPLGGGEVAALAPELLGVGAVAFAAGVLVVPEDTGATAGELAAGGVTIVSSGSSVGLALAGSVVPF